MARVVEELVLSPIHTLQTLLPLISDGGKDNNNPCLDWAPAPPATAMPAAATEPAAGIEPAAGGFPVDDLAPAPYVATTGSHVRDGPGTTHTVITTLATGATVQVTGKARGLDWYRVTLADGSVGFVWGKLLQPAAPSDTR